MALRNKYFITIIKCQHPHWKINAQNKTDFIVPAIGNINYKKNIQLITSTGNRKMSLFTLREIIIFQLNAMRSHTIILRVIYFVHIIFRIFALGTEIIIPGRRYPYT